MKTVTFKTTVINTTVTHVFMQAAGKVAITGDGQLCFEYAACEEAVDEGMSGFTGGIVLHEFQ